MKKIIVFSFLIFILEIAIVASNGKDYSTTDVDSVLLFKSNISEISKFDNKPSFDFRLIPVYLGIYKNELINNADQKMIKDVNKMAQTKDDKEFYNLIKNYHKNLNLLNFIKQKDSQFSDVIYNKTQDNTILLGELYNKLDATKKVKVLKLISDSLDFLFSNAKTSDLLMHSKICNNFGEDLKTLGSRENQYGFYPSFDLIVNF